MNWCLGAFMLTACPLGGFPWWSYLFDDRTKIVMAMEMSVAYSAWQFPGQNDS